MKKYKAYTTGAPRIAVIDILRETAHFVVLLGHNGRERRDAKRSDWCEYHDTWESAHNSLLKRAMARREEAERGLERAQE